MADVKIAEQLTRLRQRTTAPLILEIDLTDGLADRPETRVVSDRPLTDVLSGPAAMRKTRLSDVIDGLRWSRNDDRVRVVVAKVGGSGIGLARIQEIRDAIASFRESGKLAVAWAESFGEFTHGNA